MYRKGANDGSCFTQLCVCLWDYVQGCTECVGVEMVNSWLKDRLGVYWLKAVLQLVLDVTAALGCGSSGAPIGPGFFFLPFLFAVTFRPLLLGQLVKSHPENSTDVERAQGWELGCRS